MQEEGKYFPDSNKDQRRLSLHSLKLPIDQILHVIKYQPWVRLPKPSKHDLDLLEARGHCSFHGSWGHATLHCWALKRHLEDLVQRGYLEEFILDQEEDPEVGDTPSESID